MKIPISHLSHKEVERIIESFPGVRRASGASPGWEIPVLGHRYKGRVHIMHCSEGLEVHRDKQVAKNLKLVHIVMAHSSTAKKIWEELKEKISPTPQTP